MSETAESILRGIAGIAAPEEDVFQDFDFSWLANKDRTPATLQLRAEAPFGFTGNGADILRIPLKALECALSSSSSSSWLGDPRSITQKIGQAKRSLQLNLILKHWARGQLGLPTTLDNATAVAASHDLVKGIYGAFGWKGGKIWAIDIGKSDDVGRRILEHKVALAEKDPTPRYQILNSCSHVEYHLLMEIEDDKARAAAELFCSGLFRSVNTDVVKATVYDQLVSICDEAGMPRPGLVPCNYRLPLDKIGCADLETAGYAGARDRQLKIIFGQLRHASFLQRLIKSGVHHSLNLGKLDTLDKVEAELTELRAKRAHRLQELLLHEGLIFKPGRRSQKKRGRLSSLQIWFLGGISISPVQMDKIDQQLRSAGRATCNDDHGPEPLLKLFVEFGDLPDENKDLFCCGIPGISPLANGIRLMIQAVPLPSSSTSQPAIPILLEQTPVDSEPYLQLLLLLFETQGKETKEKKQLKSKQQLEDAVPIEFHHRYNQMPLDARILYDGKAILRGKSLSFGRYVLHNVVTNPIAGARAVRLRPGQDGCRVEADDFPRLVLQVADITGSFKDGPSIPLSLVGAHLDVIRPIAWTIFRSICGAFSRTNPPQVTDCHYGAVSGQSSQFRLCFPSHWGVRHLDFTPTEVQELGLRKGDKIFFFLNAVNVTFGQFKLFFGKVGSGKVMERRAWTGGRIGVTMLGLWEWVRECQRRDEGRGMPWPGRSAKALDVPTKEWAEANLVLCPGDLKRKWAEFCVT